MSKSGRKSSKELEKERPPWRTVVIAPPSKVNKNALLKAKILDATRRALLAQKINHIGTQTDAYATLMREKSIGVQKDLIQMLDKSADTDGTITIRKDRPGGLIITQTVGQMTENISSTTIATQTPLPKTYLSFASMAQTKTKWHSDSQFTPFELQMLENELLLQTQRNALKAVDSKLNGHRYNDLKAFDDNSMHKQATVKDVQQNSNFQNILPSGTSDVSQHFEIDSIAMKMRKNTVQNATFACWDEFDFSDTESDLPNLPRTTVSDGSTPWNHFQDIVIGQRMSSMTLTPMQMRPKTNTKKKTVTWNDRQLAVTKLLNEASALIDIFNDVSIMLGPEMSLNRMPVNNFNAIKIPNSKLDPILSESCKDLQNTLTSYKPKKHLSSAQLLAMPK